MRMDFSTMEIQDKGVILPSDVYRHMLVLKGSGIYHFEGGFVEIGLHSSFTIPQGMTGFIESDTGEPMLLGSVVVMDYNSSAQGVFVIPAEDTENLRKIFYFGLDIQDIELPNYDSVRAALSQLMFFLFVSTTLKIGGMNEGVFSIIQDINRHFTEPEYDVRKAIENSGYSTNHLRIIFKKETGVTPTEFVNILRLDKAEELFTQFKDRIQVKDVALQCGFKDPYYFSRKFKKRRGISPQAFVLQLMEENPSVAED